MRLTALYAILVAIVTAAGCGDRNNGSPSSVFDVPSLQTTDTVTGTGAEAVSNRTVTVHYTGWLYNPQMPGNKGEQFDSSRTRNQTFSFVLGTGNVIRGWHQGVSGMRVGGQRTLLIPSSLGYGASGAPPAIPPNSGLVFEVELLGVN